MSWRLLANCAGQHPDAFFPEPADKAGLAAAQAVCDGCAVRVECHAFAESEGILDGVWGGEPRSIGRQRAARKAAWAREHAS